MSQCGVVMLSDDKCPVLAGDCGDISLVSQSPRLQLVVVCCLNTVNRSSVHHLTRSHRREAANEKQVNQFYQTFYLSHILFLFAPVWALNAATLATDAHMALGAQPSQVLAALLSTDIHKSICPFLLLNF